MTDGWWRIKQFSPAAPSGMMVTEIRVVAADTTAITEPCVFYHDWGLEIIHSGSHVEHYPWASIVHAEYQPPTPDHPDQSIPDEDW